MAIDESGPMPRPIDAVLAEVEAEYSRASEEAPLSREGFATCLHRFEDIVDPYIDELLSGVPQSKVSALIELIRKRRSTLFLSSGLKPEIVGICKQVLSFGAAGLALSLGFADKYAHLPVPVQKTIIIGGIFYLDMLVVSLLILVLYTMQARFRYPFLYFDRIGNTWPAFYYGSISGDVPRSTLQTMHQRLKGAARYAQDFLRFASRAVNETEHQTLRAELQQYFLLLAYSGYAHQFSLRLGNLFVYGVGWSVCTCLVLIALGVAR
jgi:hypothetical protein